MCPRLIFVDLPEHGRCVVDCFFSRVQQTPSCLALYLAREGEFRSRKNTDCCGGIFWGSEPEGASIEMPSVQSVANLGGARLNILQAVIAHVTPRELPLTGNTRYAPPVPAGRVGVMRGTAAITCSP
jgi:hypothetical protein